MRDGADFCRACGKLNAGAFTKEATAPASYGPTSVPPRSTSSSAGTSRWSGQQTRCRQCSVPRCRPGSSLPLTGGDLLAQGGTQFPRSRTKFTLRSTHAGHMDGPPSENPWRTEHPSVIGTSRAHRLLHRYCRRCCRYRSIRSGSELRRRGWQWSLGLSS